MIYVISIVSLLHTKRGINNMNKFEFGDIAKGRIIDGVCMYSLINNQSYYETTYQILRKKNDYKFVHINKVKKNGVTEFWYEIDGLKNITEIIKDASCSKILEVLQMIKKEIDEIHKMGFIQFDTLDVMPEHIFYDEENNTVKFLCIPVWLDIERMAYNNFIAKISTIIAELIKNTHGLTEGKIIKIYDQCLNGEIFKYKKEKVNNVTIKFIKPEKSEMIVDKKEFTIGKSKDCDIVLTMSGAISRKHCQIYVRNEKIIVEDLKSLNGTFINEQRLEGGKEYELNENDILKIADVEIKVSNV